MKRREIIKKVILGGTSLILFPSVLKSCKKDESEPENQTEITYTIDLNDPAYADLNFKNGSVVIGSKKIIVVNHGENIFKSADSQCTYDDYPLHFYIEDPFSPINFYCSSCKSGFGLFGQVLQGPAAVTLKTYKVDRSGDILTVHLGFVPK